MKIPDEDCSETRAGSDVILSVFVVGSAFIRLVADTRYASAEDILYGPMKRSLRCVRKKELWVLPKSSRINTCYMCIFLLS